YHSFPTRRSSDLNPLVLPRLNRFISLPALYAVLSNGEQVAMPDNWRRQVEIEEDQGLLESNGQGDLRARGAIHGGAPARVRLRLNEAPDLSLSFPVHAHDAAPDVSLQAPASVTVGEELIIGAVATDDVAIKRVTFLVDGAPLT